MTWLRAIAFVAVLVGPGGLSARADSPAAPWASCACTFDGELPEGVTQDGPRLLLWRTNAVGAAAFDFGVFSNQTVAGRTVRFSDGEIGVGSFKVPAGAGDFVFAGGVGTVLKSVCGHGAFDVVSKADETRAWTNLAFACDQERLRDWDLRGGAIRAEGGAVSVVGCRFGGCAAGTFGGALYAAGLDGASEIRDTSFEGNFVDVDNGLGGAAYLSGATEGIPFAVSNSTFAVNEATSGGAICTDTAEADSGGSYPVALWIWDSTFADNAADYDGAAIHAAGDLYVEMADADTSRPWDARGTTLFTNNVTEASAAGGFGGAVTVESADTGLRAPTVRMGRRTRFAGNSVTSGNDFAEGGAIEIAFPGTTLALEGVEFRGNRARGAYYRDGTDGDYWYGAMGGAVSVSWYADACRVRVDTCVFDGNRTEVVNGDVGNALGAAVMAWYADSEIRNCTFRNQNVEAACVYAGSADVVNCVAVGNADELEALGLGGDLYFVDADVWMSYSAYGAYASDGETVAESGNLPDCMTAIYDGDTLYLDVTSYNPVAALGSAAADDIDFDGVIYGSRPEGISMGAFECGVNDDPKFELVSVTWYHCRSVGLYYPQIVVRYLSGDATRILGMTIACGGEDHELPEACVARLRTVTEVGQEVSLGVDPETFEQFAHSPERWGFVPEADRLFGVHDATRPVGFSVAVRETVRFAEKAPVGLRARQQLGAPAPAEKVPVKLSEFRIGEGLAGKADAASGVRVWLYGCERLGDEWRKVCELELDEEGRFETEKPDGLFFFRLEGEVRR